MTVDTKTVAGRREVHYDSLDDLVRDAEWAAGDNVATVGNWSVGQILRHLALTMNFSIDGFPFGWPAPLKFLMNVLMKKRFLTKPIPAGFQAPAKAAAVMPDPTSAAEGLAELKAAIERLRSETNRSSHPGLGNLTAGEWEQFHLRHSEMHLSFAVERDQG